VLCLMSGLGDVDKELRVQNVGLNNFRKTLKTKIFVTCQDSEGFQVLYWGCCPSNRMCDESKGHGTFIST